ncbi:MAG: hypothetical protein DM484_25475 [Candidatus Methylumidiphilus alinenensis]|uniref:Glycosyl transferase family 1 domain-containing protein n=1 Tax=Candidatus Methylumidiphilus alinenensis TaxID=2202197 RepID=A0A2W4QN35_9GAMM|nr:MAG: hypothetical protein DM484_25475 [Candidatus Methylumidiphilus alinenensis]
MDVKNAVIQATKETAKNIRKYAMELVDSDIESALIVANFYGDYLKNNSIGIFSDIDFEEYFAQRLLYITKGKVQNKRFETLHLMTTALTYGGHTRVVERFLNNGLGDGLASLDKLPEKVATAIPRNILKHERIRQQSGIATINSILEIGLHYEYVILHIHPEDIYSTVAAILLAKLDVRVLFYNHSDHTFSFGYSAAEKILEISKYGWIRGTIRRIVHKQTYVGIPIPVFNFNINKNNDRKFVIGVMAGYTRKFLPWGEYSVTTFLNQLFKDGETFSDMNIIICGPTGKERFWQRLDKSARDHVKFLGSIPHADYLKLISSADFYVDSFPVGNGTGFVESVMLGLPSFGLDLSTGYSYADILRSPSVADLIDALRCFRVNNAAVRRNTLEVRQRVINEQSVAVCIERIRSAMKGEPGIPLPPYLQSMNCIEDFWEKNWESNKIIHAPLRMLPNLPMYHIIKLLRCWTDTWPYSTTFLLIKCTLLRLINTLRSILLG